MIFFEGMEDTIKSAVVGVVSNATETGYRTATNHEISTLGYALSYAGGNIIEFDMVGAYDKAAVEDAIGDVVLTEGAVHHLHDFQHAHLQRTNIVSGHGQKMTG